MLINLGYINSDYIIKNIFISYQLKNLHFLGVKKFLILPDAVDVKNFPALKKINKIKKFCYMGNFYSGRGIEKIYKLSKLFSKYTFHLYGKKDTQVKLNNTKNLKIFDYVNYNFVPKLLAKYDVLLMPYEENVMVNSKSLNTAKYMSPLKMFDYLAAGKIIVSSNQKVLEEILKNNFNCFMVKKNNIKGWEEAILKITNYKNLNKICKNARKTAEKYTWNNRAKIIKKIYIDNKL